jgi:hypothetical protein
MASFFVYMYMKNSKTAVECATFYDTFSLSKTRMESLVDGFLEYSQPSSPPLTHAFKLDVTIL